MRYRDLMESNVVQFPSPKLPEPLSSLASFLTDPRPTSAMYQVGDMLTIDGEMGEVIKANDTSVLLALPSGNRVVSRRDPGLEVAAHERWSSITESVWVGDDDHPHRQGEDEWFKLFFRYFINVDEAKRMIASGEIKPERVTYPVKVIVERLFGMDSEDFGSKKFEDDPLHDAFSGPAVQRSRMGNIPAEKMMEPPLFVMFRADEAMAILDGKPLPETAKDFPVLADGNHRMVKRYLEGDKGSVECDFILWDDVKKICYGNTNGKPLSQLAK
jgi:hypothetical protein